MFHAYLCTPDGKILNIEIFLTVMGLTILGYGLIGFVHGLRHYHRLFRLDVPEPGMLKKMTPEGIAGITGGLVSSG
jgi:hypothetical protein